MESSAEHLFPTEKSPHQFIPQRSYPLPQVYSHKHLHPLSLAKTKNSILFSSSNPGFIFPISKHYISIHHDTCIYASYNTISFILRTSLLDTYHALHTANLYLSGRMQFNSHKVKSYEAFISSRITDKFLKLNRDVEVQTRS